MKSRALRYVLALCASFTALPALSATLLVLGDSISAAYGIAVEDGWVSLLRERLQARHPARYEVVNASISGETTAGGLRRLPALLEEYNPDTVIVGLGGNDGLRGLPLQQMEDNLSRIVALSRAQGAEVVLLGIELPPSYGAAFNRRFQQVYRKVGDANDVPLVPLGFSLLKDRNMLQEDGIHPTEKAQPIILDQVWPLLEKDAD
ncbi:MAG: arylesterase [Porticoccaceae bacterium]